MKTILITGGSGYVGRSLTRLLQSNGYEVNWLTRKPDSSMAIKQYTWDYKKEKIDPDAIRNADGIIHLAGAGIEDKRWSTAYKNEIYNSRVLATDFLFESVSRLPHKLKTFLASSGSGFYGIDRSEKIMVETDLPGNDFLGRTCNDWENSSKRFSASGIRTVIIRPGLALSNSGKTLKKISMPLRFHIAPIIGTGDQYFPWIHLDDLCRIFLKALTDQAMNGVYNAVAPGHLTYRQLLKTISGHFNKTTVQFRVPSWILKISLGEIAGVAVNGNKISSEKIIKSGFQFKYPNLESSMTSLFPD